MMDLSYLQNVLRFLGRLWCILVPPRGRAVQRGRPGNQLFGIRPQPHLVLPYSCKQSQIGQKWSKLGLVLGCNVVKRGFSCYRVDDIVTHFQLNESLDIMCSFIIPTEGEANIRIKLWLKYPAFYQLLVQNFDNLFSLKCSFPKHKATPETRLTSHQFFLGLGD